MRKIRIVVVAMIMMMGIIFPSFIAAAASLGETVGQNTEAALKAVDYYKDEKIASLLAPSRYSETEKLNKKMRSQSGMEEILRRSRMRRLSWN